MTKAFVVLGDRTSHGGTVIGADMTWTIHGKPVARVGDMTVCPKCKGTFPIAEGAPDHTSLGQAVARLGDKTACGAVLVPSQSVAWWSNESSSVSTATAAEVERGGLPAAVSAETPTLCLDCLEKASKAAATFVARA